jgi:hypothetical protein
MEDKDFGNKYRQFFLRNVATSERRKMAMSL